MFDSLSPEGLARLEAFYHGDTWKDFCHLLHQVGLDYEDAACKFLLMNDPAAAGQLMQRGQGILALIALFDQKFSEENEPKQPEAKPKTFHELLP